MCQINYLNINHNTILNTIYDNNNYHEKTFSFIITELYNTMYKVKEIVLEGRTPPPSV